MRACINYRSYCLGAYYHRKWSSTCARPDVAASHVLMKKNSRTDLFHPVEECGNSIPLDNGSKPRSHQSPRHRVRLTTPIEQVLMA